MGESSRAANAGNGKVGDKFFVKICQRGSRSETEKFLKKNVAIDIDRPLDNGRAPSGWPALMYACRSLNAEAIPVLLKHKADPNFCVNGGLTPLMAVAVASSEKNEDTAVTCAKLVVDAGARTMKTPKFNERTVLTRAVLKNAPKLAKYLIEGGTTVNERDGCGETPLNVALKMNFGSVAKNLIELGANPFVNNLNGDNCVDIATNSCKNLTEIDGDLLNMVIFWRMEYFEKNFGRDRRRFQQMLKAVNRNCQRKEGPMQVRKKHGMLPAQIPSIVFFDNVKPQLPPPKHERSKRDVCGAGVNLEDEGPINRDSPVRSMHEILPGTPEPSTGEESVYSEDILCPERQNLGEVEYGSLPTTPTSSVFSSSGTTSREESIGAPLWTLLLGTALLTFLCVRGFDRVQGSRN